MAVYLFVLFFRGEGLASDNMWPQPMYEYVVFIIVESTGYVRTILCCVYDMEYF